MPDTPVSRLRSLPRAPMTDGATGNVNHWVRADDLDAALVATEADFINVASAIANAERYGERALSDEDCRLYALIGLEGLGFNTDGLSRLDEERRRAKDALGRVGVEVKHA